jgi:hypothetical protein
MLPLIPVLRDDCPGSLARDIEQLATWFGKVYDSDARGLLDAWRCVLRTTSLHSSGAVHLDTGEVYKNPMPLSITSTKLELHCFITNSLSPALLHGLDRKAADELLRVLIDTLNKNFFVPSDPEKFLARAHQGNESAKETSPPDTIIIIGSSIMGRVAGHLRTLGLSVVDLSVPGWIATADNINSLIVRMSELKITGNFAVVLDLHSNSSFRFLQFDGTLALPVKDAKKFHFPGEIRLVADDIFKKITDSLKPVLLSAQKNVKIIIPPLPRYLFTKCCANPGHGVNFGQDWYQEKILDGCTHLRNTLKKCVVDMGTEKFWVLDGMGAVLGVNSGTDRGGNREILADLEPFMANDGVHLSEAGYKNLARVIKTTITSVYTGKLGKQNIATNTGTLPAQERSYYWRGYISPCGSVRPRSGLKSRAGKQWRHHGGHGGPYHHHGNASAYSASGRK